MSYKLNFEERTILKELLKDLWDYYGNSSCDDIEFDKLFPDLTMRRSVMRPIDPVGFSEGNDFKIVSKGQLLEFLLTLL